MRGIPYDEQMKWRRLLETGVNNLSDKRSTFSFVHPPVFYNYEFKHHKSESELKEWELNQLRDCDVMVINLEDINASIGAHFELGFANAMNMFGGKHIFIIGIGTEQEVEGLHPWIQESIFRLEPDIPSAAKFISSYLLV